MHLSGLARKFMAWIACAAILMGSMAPLLTQALEHASEGSAGQGWVEVCTAMGTMRVDAGDSGPDGPAHKLPAGQGEPHCAFCASHAPTLGMPPASAAAFFIPSLRHLVPELFLKSPRPLFAWSTALPRAPPFVS